MGYQVKGLRINSKGIVNPIKVEELPHYVGLGYVRKEGWECSKIASDKLMTNDDRTSTHSNDIEGSIGTYNRCTINKHSKTIHKVWRRDNHYHHCNEVGRQRATCQILHAQKASIKKPVGEDV